MMVAATMAARLPEPTMRAAPPVAAIRQVAAICPMVATPPKIQTTLSYSNGFCNQWRNIVNNAVFRRFDGISPLFRIVSPLVGIK